MSETEHIEQAEEQIASPASSNGNVPGKKPRRSFGSVMRLVAEKLFPFSLLDRYILGKFLGTFVFAILLLLAIVVMFDINEKLDAFQKAPLSETINEYYVNFLPYFANQFAPLFTFIAVIFFTSKLANNSEIIAMLSTGMS